jgi:ABC-type dipeptide/oligopeptide/nickel transport system permease subunit
MSPETFSEITPDTEELLEPKRHRSLWGDVVTRFRQNKLAVVGLGLVIFICILGFGAPVIAPDGHNEQDLDQILQFPSWEHPLGTDYLGRDMVARIAYATRTSLIVALLTQLVALVIGVPLGALAGWRGGTADWLVSRVVDVFSALPWYLIAIYLISVIQPGMRNIIIALGIASWVGPCRLLRAQFLTLRQREFVLSARVIGAGSFRLVRVHMLPNALTPIIISVAIGIPAAVFGEAGLSFLGLGIAPPSPSLGQMVQEGLGYFLVFWFMVLVPAALIALIVLGFTMMGDGLRDALDPRQQIR